MIKIKSLFKCVVDYKLCDCAIIQWFTGGNAKCDVGLCQFTVGDNV